MEKFNEFILSEEQKQKANIAKQIMRQLLDIKGALVCQEKIVSIIFQQVLSLKLEQVALLLLLVMLL